jgi:hypothetical protein
VIRPRRKARTNYFWNSIALSLLQGRHHSLLANARLLALLNLAMAYAGIACWMPRITLTRGGPSPQSP